MPPGSAMPPGLGLPHGPDASRCRAARKRHHAVAEQRGGDRGEDQRGTGGEGLRRHRGTCAYGERPVTQPRQPEQLAELADHEQSASDRPAGDRPPAADGVQQHGEADHQPTPRAPGPAPPRAAADRRRRAPSPTPVASPVTASSHADPAQASDAARPGTPGIGRWQWRAPARSGRRARRLPPWPTTAMPKQVTTTAAIDSTAASSASSRAPAPPRLLDHLPRAGVGVEQVADAGGDGPHHRARARSTATVQASSAGRCTRQVSAEHVGQPGRARSRARAAPATARTRGRAGRAATAAAAGSTAASADVQQQHPPARLGPRPQLGRPAERRQPAQPRRAESPTARSRKRTPSAPPGDGRAGAACSPRAGSDSAVSPVRDQPDAGPGRAEAERPGDRQPAGDVGRRPAEQRRRARRRARPRRAAAAQQRVAADRGAAEQLGVAGLLLAAGVPADERRAAAAPRRRRTARSAWSSPARRGCARRGSGRRARPRRGLALIAARGGDPVGGRSGRGPGGGGRGVARPATSTQPPRPPTSTRSRRSAARARARCRRTGHRRLVGLARPR